VRSSLLRRLSPALLLVALVGTACDTTSNNAAKVNGHAISAASLTDELAVIECNDVYREALESSYGGQLAGVSKGTFNNTFVSQLLGIRIYYALLEDRLADAGVEITDDDIATARQTTDQQLEGLGKGATRCFSSKYKDKLVRQEALIGASQELAAEHFLEETLDDLEVACASHILVKTEAEADAVKAELDGGADFAEVAQATTTDEGSKATGGDLGCQPRGSYVTEFDEAVWDLPLDEVSDPVQTEFGFHLILVRERRAGTAEDLPAESGQQALNAFLVDVVCGKSADVSITPSYGTWDRTPCKDGAGLARVAPPTPPEAK
jgi:foldase protein PrsA